jgi:branched-chain amino acid transport system permease protein
MLDGAKDRELARSVARRLARARAPRVIEIALLVAALVAPFALPKTMLLLNEIVILALFAMSLDLILGYAGIVSLGHAAFLGVGAYAAGLFALHVSADPLAGLAAGMLCAGLAGFGGSFLIIRGSDLTRLMVTLGVALLLRELANTFSSVSGGADGLQGIVMAPVLGLFSFDLKGQTGYLYSLAVLVVLYLVARRVMLSPFGLSLRGIRDNRLRAAASGIPIARRAVLVYTFAAVYAGAAGALLAQTNQFVSLDVLDFHRSADLMLVLIIGGAGKLYGGIIGAVVFQILQDRIALVTPQYWQFWIGLLLVLYVLGGRELMQEAAGALRSRLRPASSTEPA